MLKVENIEAKYGRIAALRGVSFHVPNGNIVAVLGSNGAGKTTTLNVISGLMPTTSGTIHFLGKRLNGLPANAIARLGIAHVPEGRHIFSDLTVEENLKLGAYILRDSKQVQEGLELSFSLFPILKKRFVQTSNTLSGGEQQMLVIARGLMSKPKLLMLDEPSLGLAPLLVEELFSILERLRRKGATILLVEQNAAAALSVVDYGYVLEMGKTILGDSGMNLEKNELVRKAYLGL